MQHGCESSQHCFAAKAATSSCSRGVQACAWKGACWHAEPVAGGRQAQLACTHYLLQALQLGCPATDSLRKGWQLQAPLVRLGLAGVEAEGKDKS